VHSGRLFAKKAARQYADPTSNSESHHLPSRIPKFVSFYDSDPDVGMGLGLQRCTLDRGTQRSTKLLAFALCRECWHCYFFCVFSSISPISDLLSAQPILHSVFVNVILPSGDWVFWQVIVGGQM
jgi:hypothetical protein